MAAPALFPEWRCRKEDVTVLRNYSAAEELLLHASQPLATRDGNAATAFDDAEPLSLFGCAPVHPRGPLSAADAVANAGAPVWALDVLPMRTGGDSVAGDPALVLVVGANSAPVRPITVATPGPGALQIWEVVLATATDGDANADTADADADEPETDPQPLRPKKRGRTSSTAVTAPPAPTVPAAAVATASTGPASLRLSLLLVHDHGSCRDARWCPIDCRSPASPGSHPRLGLLAAAFTSGVIALWSVPDPSSLPSSPPGEGTGGNAAPPLAIRLPPSWVGRPGGGGLPTCVAWDVANPHPTLAAGTTTGAVVIWRLPLLPPGDGDAGGGPATGVGGLSLPSPEPQWVLASGCHPVRTLIFSPVLRGAQAARAAWGDTEAGEDGDHGGRVGADVVRPPPLLASGGHDGRLRVYDLRDPVWPIWDSSLGTGWVTGLTWPAADTALVASVDIGDLRGLPTQHVSSAFARHHHRQHTQSAEALWCIDAFAGCGLTAFAGDAGTLWLAPLPTNPRAYDDKKKAGRVRGLGPSWLSVHAVVGEMAVTPGADVDDHTAPALAVWGGNTRKWPANKAEAAAAAAMRGGGAHSSKGKPAKVVALGPPPAHPSMSIHRLRLAPGPGKRPWLVSAGEAGLIRAQLIKPGAVRAVFTSEDE